MMSGLIGKSIQNAMEHHSVINVKVGVDNHIAGVKSLVKTQGEHNQEIIENIQDL